MTVTLSRKHDNAALFKEEEHGPIMLQRNLDEFIVIRSPYTDGIRRV